MVFARSSGKNLPETKRMVRERRALSGIKKIFRDTAFVTLNIDVVEKGSTQKADL